jgi:hypothetical protein
VFHRLDHPEDRERFYHLPGTLDHIFVTLVSPMEVGIAVRPGCVYNLYADRHRDCRLHQRKRFADSASSSFERVLRDQLMPASGAEGQQCDAATAAPILSVTSLAERSDGVGKRAK